MNLSYRNIYLSLLLLFLLGQLSAQSPYSFSAKGDGILGGISTGIFTTSLIINENMEEITFKEWNLLSRDSVCLFDRYATTRWAGKAEKARLNSDRLLFSSVLVPFAVAIGSSNSHNDLGTIGLLTIETAALNLGLTNLAKGIFKRKRPFTFNREEMPWKEMEKQNLKDARRSFFSGHASTAASMYVMSAKIFSDYHPDSKWRPAVWAGAFVVPALTGLLRVKGGKHYATDVITGFVVGSAIGFLVPHFHKN